MKNWSTDIDILANNSDKLAIWKIEQMVNFGLDNERLKKEDLLKYWNDLNLDPDKKKYLERLLHE